MNPNKDRDLFDDFLPLMPLTRIWTTKPNPKVQNEIAWELWHYTRRWGIKGLVLGPMQESNETPWYQVLNHGSSVIGYYHETELEIRYDDDDNSNDNYGDDDSDGDDIPPFYPDDSPVKELEPCLV